MNEALPGAAVAFLGRDGIDLDPRKSRRNVGKVLGEGEDNVAEWPASS